LGGTRDSVELLPETGINAKSCIFIPAMQTDKPNINSALLWEYNLQTFNWVKSYKIVIERVLQLGNLQEWQEMYRFYTTEQIKETIAWSAQLDKRDKDFSLMFLNADFLHVSQE
jgi:hypothetical protein